MSVHVSVADLVERPDDPRVQDHLSSCPSCRARSRLVTALDAEPDGEARDVLASAVERARDELVASLGGRPEDEEDLEPGRVLDRYVVEARLGAGGMGTVYRVRHAGLGSLHALKVLRGRSREERERLLREGRAQGRLRHPNVVQVTDAIVVDGLPALVLELVDGPTLAKRLREGPLPQHLADVVAQGVLRGVAAAHRVGLVHRDLKPSNVLLAEADGVVVPKVTDFGLARQDTETGLTRSHAPLGTLAYMAPEQIRDASRAGPRSDVFALGALLHEVLAGARPYEGRSAVELYERIRSGPIPPLTGVPRAWSDAIRRALSFAPEDRFADAAELLAAWRGEVAPERRRSWRWAIALAAIAAVAIAAAAVWTGRSEPAPRSPDTDRRLTARADDLQVFSVAVSPDGREIAYTDSRGVTRQDVQTGRTTVVASSGPYHDVDWFPDGQRLLLYGTRDGENGVWSVAADGSEPVLLHRGSPDLVRLSPDGARFAVADPTGLWVHGVADGSRRRVRPLGGADATAALAWSPDGRTLAAIHRSAAGDGAWLELTSADGATTRRVLVHEGLLSLALGTMTWLPPDRLLFGLREGMDVRWMALDGASEASDASAAVEVRRMSGFSMTQLRSSLDGKRIVYSRVDARAIPYVQALDGGDPRPLTNEEWHEEPLGWPSGDAIWLKSSSMGPAVIQRPLSGGPAEVVIPDAGPMTRIDRVGDDLVWLGLDKRKGVMRVKRARDGVVEEVLSRPFEPHRYERYGMRCRDRCLLATMEGPEPQFSWVDLETGALTPVDVPAPGDARTLAWDLAPDGRRLAIATPPHRLMVHDLERGTVEKWALPMLAPTELVWSADGERLFVSGLTYEAEAYRLLEVGPTSSRTLWSSMSWYLFRPTPSPDGKFLAFGAYAFDDDLWLAEGLDD